MKATITAKGQITLPAELRRKQGWVNDTILEFDASVANVVMRQTKRRRNPRSVIGCLAPTMPQSVENYLTEICGLAELSPEIPLK